MKEVNGDLWTIGKNRDDIILCITTNGFVKYNGEAVMGRGCALEAKRRYPDAARRLGDHIRKFGNVLCWLNSKLIAFPVKHEWFQKADPGLIRLSAEALKKEANNLPHMVFVLPRPGCGNGKLEWKDVEPLLRDLPDNVWVITH